ncbi:hypothetical protein AYO20_09496 [Fonsecaea nubica]|uniref:Ubiquitin-like protease family profile domain-containing protein n=1 Tax=Fonsecaea nubica TaxID=856822 RepID=A0A178CEG8_9EURO|nr:hypothetical protein AYO20_09496 [Fonsecaea nubica]OAL28379.1 hypothetical protein AYO20_09496 [Fonsecaea nubica]
MSFMLMQTPDPRTIKDALPDFTNVSHIFLPINDNHSASIAEGGTHWSLLLVSIVDGVAFHYDSMPPGNQHEAHYVTQKLSRLINKPLRFIQLTDSPLQDNSSDCGVFVCLNMRHLLLKRLLMVRTDAKVSMSLGDRRVDASAGRKEMLCIIEEFRREGERRRSVISAFTITPGANMGKLMANNSLQHQQLPSPRPKVQVTTPHRFTAREIKEQRTHELVLIRFHTARRDDYEVM